jgi:peroxiredoxin Q/BCP
VNVQIGDRIPDFRAPASTGQTLSWEAYRDKIPVILFFLSGTDRDGDAEELQGFDRLLSDFGSRRIQVLGVVKRTASEVRDLAGELRLDVPVLADPSGALAQAVDADRHDFTFRRATFVFDRTGRLAKELEPDSHAGHAQEVLDAVDELAASDEWSFEPAVP